MTFLLAYTLLYIVLIAIINSVETAVYTVSELKLKRLVESENSKSAKTILEIKEKISRFIGAISITINTTNQVGTVLLGIAAKNIIQNDFWFSVYVTSLVFVTILFGEIIPKNFGENFSLKYSLFVAPILKLWLIILSPMVWVLDLLIKLIFPNDGNGFITSEEEIKLMIQMGADESSIEKDEHEIIQNVFKMNDKVAKDIMTPRVHIDALDADLTLEQQKEIIFAVGHSRLPVYGEDYDDIKGFVLLRDVLEEMAKDNSHILSNDEKLLHKIVAVKETTKVDQLLICFQKNRVHMAVVVDDFGGTSGLVTLEDVLEQLVGEIVDETDTVVDLQKEKNENQKDIQMVG